MEFSTEEMDNIKTVIRHIEKETCIEFRDLTVVHNPGDTSSESDTTVEDKDNYVILGLLPNETKKPLPNFTSSEITETDTLGPPLEVVPIPMSGAAARRTVKPDLKPAKNKTKKVPPTPGRRHAENVLVLARSAMPGCACPRPGNPDGKHVLRINADCFNSVNDLLHVFVHILGLDHQHNMHDRDSYLHIVWDQLTEGVRKEMKQKLPPAASVGFGYDYQSVMHYPWLQIKNGRTNIMYPIWNDGWAMGHWQGLSSVDVQKLNMLYFKQCVERKQQALQADPFIEKGFRLYLAVTNMSKATVTHLQPALGNRSSLLLLHDNARPHTAQQKVTKCQELGLEALPLKDGHQLTTTALAKMH
ncbi:unnamed protein product [Chrysodeixis includens]|uniref:Peptidase M12A domain-containing protein n=1 Tax=Chrysodeixis includens TaxID=689277 RepID=A0A9P0BUV0_CHRIL|nr:unnamed protein product [Chrysodeixis includens]